MMTIVAVTVPGAGLAFTAACPFCGDHHLHPARSGPAGAPCTIPVDDNPENGTGERLPLPPTHEDWLDIRQAR